MERDEMPMMRQDQLVVQETVDETLVYDLKIDKACCLNQTASLVWKYCNGQNTATYIAQLIEKDTGSQVPVELVWLTIDQLEKENLLKKQAQPNKPGLSRRELIRRAGIATALALPIVATLSFPQSSLAFTCAASFAGVCATDGSNGCPSGSPQLCQANGECVTVPKC